MTDNTANILTQYLRDLAAARRVERQAAEWHAQAQANLAATTEAQVVEHTKGLLKEARETVTLAEEAVRFWTLHLYRKTGNKKPVSGVGVRILQKALYDMGAALAWCKVNAPAFLSLDTKHFEQAALAGLPGAPVEITETPQATIAADLSMYEEAE